MNKNVLRNISYGVYVVSTKNGDKSTGCIVNSIMQITSDTIALSVNHQNYTNESLKKNKKFAISILSTDVDDNIIPVFGFQSGRDCEKFKDIEKINVQNIDIIKNSIGYLICELTGDTIETDTHSLFLAKILDGEMLNEKEPMTYSYYHRVKKGTSPKTAPTYIEEKPTDELAYRCKICGYIYKGDITKEPDDYICPVCKKPKSFFEKV